MSAAEELEYRAVMVALSGEYVGTAPLLTLLRVALDEYHGALGGHTVKQTQLTRDYALSAAPPYALINTRTGGVQEPVRGALSLYQCLRKDDARALRVLIRIEEATARAKK